MRYVIKIILTLVLFLFISGCQGFKQPANKMAYYTLEYQASRFQGLAPLSALIKIQRFSVAPDYNTEQIIYRDKSYARSAYPYERWRANPGDMVAHFLARDMKESGLFMAVIPGESGIRPSHLIEGSVDQFLEWDMEEAWHAVLSLSITLLTANQPDTSKVVLFQKTYRATVPCRQRNPKGLAEAMSLAMARISGEIIQEIHGRLRP